VVRSGIGIPAFGGIIGVFPGKPTVIRFVSLHPGIGPRDTNGYPKIFFSWRRGEEEEREKDILNRM